MKRAIGLENKARLTVLVTALCICSTLTLGFNHLANKKRDFQGRIRAELCRKAADGRWEVFDTLEVPNVRLTASLTELASGKEVSSDFTFRGRSAEGRQINVRMKGTGKGSADLSDGKVGLDLPLELTLDGKTSSFMLSLSTETAMAANGGTVSGKRARIDFANRTATLSMVGNAKFQSSIGSSEKTDDLKAAKPADLLLVIQSGGKLTAVEQ